MSDAFYPGGVYFKGIEMDKKSDGNKRIDIKFEKKNKLFKKKSLIFFLPTSQSGSGAVCWSAPSSC